MKHVKYLINTNLPNYSTITKYNNNLLKTQNAIKQCNKSQQLKKKIKKNHELIHCHQEQTSVS